MTTKQLTIAEVEKEIADISAQIRPLARRIDELERMKSRLDSKNWIAANKVRLEDVELSRGENKPWFGDILNFAKWVKTNSTKRFFEWNGRIYFTAELYAGR